MPTSDVRSTAMSSPTDIDEARDVYLMLFEDEATLLETHPTEEELGDLYENRAFRYYLLRLRKLHNQQVDQVFSPGISNRKAREARGMVRGLRMALGLPRLLVEEAQRSREVAAPESAAGGGPLEYDDFGPGLAGEKETG